MHKKDPTATLTIRKIAIRQINKKFNNIKGVINKTLIKNRVLVNVTPGEKDRFTYLRDSEKLKEFMYWLNEQIKSEILDNPNNHWLNAYIGKAYEKGARKTRNTLSKDSIEASLVSKTSVFSNPAHVERAKLLYDRVYMQLKGVTQVMEQQMSKVLSDGIMQGESVKTIAKNLNDRVDKIGKTRSRLIVRTEVVNAHNVASIKETDIMENILGKKLKMIWITALDGRERDSHRARHKKLYTKKEAIALIGEPNCRCSVSAYEKY